ncbi:MAG: type II toxin-antitoxin system VapC family toxin [Thermoanaerobaculia bacterium]|nr:type II toxin-antitoxin system VapC family toxin [Thermoanaerobaculia bacterium]
MKIAFDTSILVAALVEAHSFHQHAKVWLKDVALGRHVGVASWHALAETWAVLTRLPLRPRLSPEQAHQVLTRLREHIVLVELRPALYEQAIARCLTAGATSGAVFDGLHLVAARNAGAEVLLTFNADDFSRLRLDGDPEIVVPPDPHQP